MDKFKIGDTIISRNRSTAFLKKDTPYEVFGISDKGDPILIVDKEIGTLNYPSEWFELAQAAPTPAPAGYYDFTFTETEIVANNTPEELISKPLYLEDIPTKWKLGVDDLEKTEWFDKVKTEPAKASHVMKSWTHFFQAIKAGLKKHDLRKMDRDFRVGQHVILQEYDNINGRYTGETLEVRITYITSENTPCAFSSAVLEKGYAILSIEVVE